jgi:NAD dependent epimerase/dehydratase family enzyme
VDRSHVPLASQAGDWIGDGSGSVPIHGDDVVDMMIVAAAHPAAHNQTFNCVHPDPVTWREFLLSYAQAGHQSWLGIPPTISPESLTVAVVSPPAAGQSRARSFRCLYSAPLI